MTDDQLREELDRLSGQVGSEAPDVGSLLTAGRRQLRARQLGILASGVVGTTVVALGATALVRGGPVDDVVAAPGSTSASTTPAPSATDLPAVTDSPQVEPSTTEPRGRPTSVEVAIDDRGGQIQGFGFGVAVASMLPATDSAGNVTFQPISKEQAAQSCDPVLAAIVPGSTAADWTLTSPDEDFPSHATRYVRWQHDDTTYATCVLPGGPVDIPMPTGVDYSVDGILEPCSAIADVDLTGFSVVAFDADDGTEAAMLRSADNHLARCVLSDDPAQRTVQIHEAPIGSQPALQDGLLYGTYWTKTFTSAGYVGEDAATVVVTIAGVETTALVNHGFYAMVIALDSPLSTDDDFRGRVEDATGAVIWAGDWQDFGLLPTECLTSVELGHGC